MLGTIFLGPGLIFTSLGTVSSGLGLLPKLGLRHTVVLVS